MSPLRSFNQPTQCFLFFLGAASSSSSPLSRSFLFAFFSNSSQSSPALSSSSLPSSLASAEASSANSESSSEDSSEAASSESDISKADSSDSSSSSSSSDSAWRKDQPPSAKKACGSAVTVFMIVGQLRLSTPSLKGMLTESSHSLTFSRDSTGIVLM